MLKDRGYFITNDKLNTAKEDIKKLIEAAPTIEGVDQSEQTSVFYTEQLNKMYQRNKNWVDEEKGAAAEANPEEPNQIKEKGPEGEAARKEDDPAKDLIKKQEQLAVFWCCDIDQKMNGMSMDRIQIKAESLSLDRIIVIVNDMSSQARKNERSITIKTEVIALDDIQVNITHHHLVPKHEVLSDNMKFELLKKYRIKVH